VGAQGAPGTNGPTGGQGAQGSTGSQGISGPVGPPGNPGPQGGQGAQGAQGNLGPTGTVQGAQGAQGAQGTPSDKRLKDNVVKLENVLQTTKRIEGVTFIWDNEHFKIKDNKSIAVKTAFEGKSYGVIAQQIEEVVPSIVFTDDEGYKSVNYGLMVSLGIGSVQEQQHRINSIYERINILKDKISG
jgi:hypothetical protein